MKSLIILFRRKNRKNQWYAQFLNPATNRYEVTRSIKSLYEKIQHKPFAKCGRIDATLIANRALESGLITFPNTGVVPIGEDRNDSDIAFNNYCLEFWDYDNSRYVKRKNLEKQNSINRTHVRESLARFQKHVKPFISDNLKLNEFKPCMMEEIKDRLLFSGVSSSTINKVLCSVRSPLKEAYRLGFISEDIASKIENITNTSRRYGCLTQKEARELLKYLDRQCDHVDYGRWLYLMVAIALCTGMRESEIRALQMSDFEIIDEGNVRVLVTKSWNKDIGIKSTKNGRPNVSRIPFWLYEQILVFSGHFRQEFIFFNPRPLKSKVIEPSKISKEFKNALKAIGLTEEQIKKRNLAFHSTRVFFASVTNGRIADEERMMLMNHSSYEMTAHYTHETDERLKSMGRVMDEIIPVINGGRCIR